MQSIYIKTLAVILALFVIVCKGSGQSPIDPAKAIPEAEDAIRAHYFFAEGQGWTFAQLFNAAALAVNPEKGEAVADRTALVRLIESLPAGEQRAATFRALDAMVASLPRGYNACTKPENRGLDSDPNRRAGVGLVLNMDQPGRVVVVDTLEGSAAYRAQAPIGVYLKSVDGKSIAGMDVADVASLIRGQPGEAVRIEFENGQTLNLDRAEVVFRNILNSSWRLPGDRAAEYIMIRAASGDAAEQLRGLFQRMGPRDTVILDLRRLFNGDYDRAFAIANLFTNTGRLGAVQYRDQARAEFVSDVDRIYSGTLYVILGERSSPFAEAIAAALAPAPNVTIVGQQGEGAAFLTHLAPIDSGAALTLTSGIVLGPDDRPLYEAPPAVDLSAPAPLPLRAPLDTPDREDAMQVWASPFPERRSGQTQGATALVNKQTGQISQRSHVNKKKDGPADAVQLAHHRRQRAHTLTAKRKENHQRHRHQRSEDHGSIAMPGSGQTLAQRWRFFVGALANAVDNAKRGDDHLTRRECAQDSHGDAPVKTKRRKDRLNGMAHSTQVALLQIDAGDAIVAFLLQPGAVVFIAGRGNLRGKLGLDALRHLWRTREIGQRPDYQG